MTVRHPAKRGQKLTANADATITADWSFTGTLTIPEATVTAHEGAIDHDALLNFDQAEHFTQSEISITVSQISDFSSSGLLNIVEDLTPQLGGKLDGLGKSIENISSLFINASVATPDSTRSGESQYWVKDTRAGEPWFTTELGANSAIPRNAFTETITAEWLHEADLTMDNAIAVNWKDFAAASVELAVLSGGGGDADFANVVFLMDVENTGGEGDQAFLVNVGGHTVTAAEGSTGIAEVRGAKAKFGSFSIFNDDEAGIVLARWGTTVNSTDFDFGSGDFTFECHLLFNRLSSTNIPVFAKWAYPNFSFHWDFDSVNEKFFFTYSTNGIGPSGGTAIAWPTATYNLNQWYHMACARQGTTIRFFVDGVLCSTQEAVSTDAFHTGSEEFELFSTSSAGAADHSTYMDNARITKGVARYTATFTPPTAAFATSGGTPEGFTLGDPSYKMFFDATEIRVRGATVENYLQLDHDDTDFNIAGVNTTDINITSITAINAGTVDADFAALTATSYGGVVEANLLDKSASETIVGATWAFAAITATTYDGVAAANLVDKVAAEAISGAWTYSGNLISTGYFHVRGATTAALDAIANAINTGAGKVQGAMVYNTDTDNPVYAAGNADGSIWVDGAGATAHSPA
jgi:hypothetical protein